ncbi:transglutaminase family protein [Foetidibacter luteolus]|uniref:transglutaminase family protein n=1 Tax=Foetidibacter luteolus TaxID=2608880 RepID=UPI00129A6D74|nr:transglutaminase family protein [Foetidibacter luteolus]
MPIFRIHHVTKYEYDRPVKESMNEIKIFPYPCPEQETLSHETAISGQPDVQYFKDYWGNKAGVFSLMAPHKEMVIESRLVLRTTSSSQIQFNFHAGFDELKQDMKGKLQLLELSTPENIQSQPEIDKIVQHFYEPGKSVAQVTEQCCEYIFKYFKYIKGITDIESTVDEILAHRSGVCQDFAHVMLQVLRTLGIPSRYVSGYICPNKSGMRGEGATHAWVEAWMPGYGWAGIDPTNNVWTTNSHIKLAVGRSFKDCTPVKGTFKGPSKQRLSIHVSVGYEDGHVFEEVNNVKMHVSPSDSKEEIFVDESFGQQQQQQQQQ